MIKRLLSALILTIITVLLLNAEARFIISDAVKQKNTWRIGVNAGGGGGIGLSDGVVWNQFIGGGGSFEGDEERNKINAVTNITSNGFCASAGGGLGVSDGYYKNAWYQISSTDPLKDGQRGVIINHYERYMPGYHTPMESNSGFVFGTNYEYWYYGNMTYFEITPLTNNQSLTPDDWFIIYRDNPPLEMEYNFDDHVLMQTAVSNRSQFHTVTTASGANGEIHGTNWTGPNPSNAGYNEIFFKYPNRGRYGMTWADSTHYTNSRFFEVMSGDNKGMFGYVQAIDTNGHIGTNGDVCYWSAYQDTNVDPWTNAFSWTYIIGTNMVTNQNGELAPEVALRTNQVFPYVWMRLVVISNESRPIPNGPFASNDVVKFFENMPTNQLYLTNVPAAPLDWSYRGHTGNGSLGVRFFAYPDTEIKYHGRQSLRLNVTHTAPRITNYITNESGTVSTRVDFEDLAQMQRQHSFSRTLGYGKRVHEGDSGGGGTVFLSDRRYRFSFWAKSSNVEQQGCLYFFYSKFQSEDPTKPYVFTNIFHVSNVDKWTKYEYEWTGDGVNARIYYFYWTPLDSGTYWIDDMRMEDITEFRSDRYQHVSMNYNLEYFREMYPGAIRAWGASSRERSVDTMTRPMLERRGSGLNGMFLPELLDICEQVNADAWLVASPSWTISEWSNLTEYIYGPITTVYGARRTANGHPEPYDNIKNIYMEMANEAWGSLFCPWCWPGDPEGMGKFTESIASNVKKMPYYNPAIKFLLNGMGENTGPSSDGGLGQSVTALDNCPSCAGSSVNGYTGAGSTFIAGWGRYEYGLEIAAIPEVWWEDVYQWQMELAAGYIDEYTKEPKKLYGYETHQAISAGDMRYLTYPLEGTTTDWYQPYSRKTVLTGVNMPNFYLYSMMRGYGQMNYFAWIADTSGNESESHWGPVNGYNKRMRTIMYLGVGLVNRNMGDGPMITATEDPEYPSPTFSTIEEGGGGLWGESKGPYPTITVYPFKEGDRYAYMIFNRDLRRDATMRLSLPYTPSSNAYTYLLAPPTEEEEKSNVKPPNFTGATNIMAVNEMWENVTPKFKLLSDFSNEYELYLPYTSLTVLVNYVEGSEEEGTRSEAILKDLNVTQISDKEVTVIWDSVGPTLEKVYYGTGKFTFENVDYPVMTNIYEDNEYRTEHKVRLTNLSPSTTYYMMVKSILPSGAMVTSSNMKFSTLAFPDKTPPESPDLVVYPGTNDINFYGTGEAGCSVYEMKVYGANGSEYSYTADDRISMDSWGNIYGRIDVNALRRQYPLASSVSFSIKIQDTFGNISERWMSEPYDIGVRGMNATLYESVVKNGKSAKIVIEIEAPAECVIDIFNRDGKKVDTILSGELPAGVNIIEWAGEYNKRKLPAGLYIAKVQYAGIERVFQIALVH